MLRNFNIIYMLDLALEPSYSLLKNLLLLPCILKLIVDMVHDSSPSVITVVAILIICYWKIKNKF